MNKNDKKREVTPVNNGIKASQIRLVGDNENRIMLTKNALNEARNAGLDLVAVSNIDSDMPICRILDYSKYKYDLSKKEKEKKRRIRENKVITKEMQFRPVTDDHDLQIKIEKIKKFIDDGCKVKIMVKFRGREVDNTDHDRIPNAILESLPDAIFESEPKLNGRNLIGVLKKDDKK